MFLPQVEKKAEEVVAHHRDAFYSDVNLWTLDITKGDGRWIVYHLLCEFIRDAGLTLWGD
jgi:hypothetical protein